MGKELYRIYATDIKTETIYENFKETKRYHISKLVNDRDGKWDEDRVYCPDTKHHLSVQNDVFRPYGNPIEESYINQPATKVFDLILNIYPEGKIAITKAIETLGFPYHFHGEYFKISHSDLEIIFSKLRSTLFLLAWRESLYNDYDPTEEELKKIWAHMCVLIFSSEKNEILGTPPLLKEWIYNIDILHHRARNDNLSIEELAVKNLYCNYFNRYYEHRGSGSFWEKFIKIIGDGVGHYLCGQESVYNEYKTDAFFNSVFYFDEKHDYRYYICGLEDFLNFDYKYVLENIKELLNYVLSENISFYINHVGYDYVIDEKNMELVNNYKHLICFLYYQITQIDFKKYIICKCDGVNCDNYTLQNKNLLKSKEYVFCSNSNCAKQFNNKKNYIGRKLVIFEILHDWYDEANQSKCTFVQFKEHMKKKHPNQIKHVNLKMFQEYQVIYRINKWEDVNRNVSTTYDSFCQYINDNDPSFTKHVNEQIFYEYRIGKLFRIWKEKTKGNSMTYHNFIKFLKSEEQYNAFATKLLFKVFSDQGDLKFYS